jgi:hypothetical protein
MMHQFTGEALREALRSRSLGSEADCPNCRFLRERCRTDFVERHDRGAGGGRTSLIGERSPSPGPRLPGPITGELGRVIQLLARSSTAAEREREKEGNEEGHVGIRPGDTAHERGGLVSYRPRAR